MSGMERANALQSLRVQIRGLEGPPAGAAGVLPLGIPEIDQRLPHGVVAGSPRDAVLAGGLPRAAVHEIVEAGGGAGTAFAAHLLGRLAAAEPGKAVLWCVRGPAAAAGALYAPGLAALGVPVERLIVVTAATDAEALWTFEEALRCPALAGVVAEVERVPLTASRRLQLAAETGGATGLLLRRARALGIGGAVAGSGGQPMAQSAVEPTAAATRWHVMPAPSASPRHGLGAGDGDGGGDLDFGLGAPRWQLALQRARSGGEGQWTVERDHATGDLSLAAAAVDGPDRAGTGDRTGRGASIDAGGSPGGGAPSRRQGRAGSGAVAPLFPELADAA